MDKCIRIPQFAKGCHSTEERGHVSSQMYLLVLKPWGTGWDLGLLGRGHGRAYPSFPNLGKTLVWFKLNERPESVGRLVVIAKADTVSSATVGGQIKPLPGEEVVILLCASIKDKIGVTFLFHCCICSSSVNSEENHSLLCECSMAELCGTSFLRVIRVKIMFIASKWFILMSGVMENWQSFQIFNLLEGNL